VYLVTIEYQRVRRSGFKERTQNFVQDYTVPQC
jgi:hypothetical protein